MSDERVTFEWHLGELWNFVNFCFACLGAYTFGVWAASVIKAW